MSIYYDKQRIEFAEDYHSEGISVTYRKRDRRLFFSGWYDSIVGIPGGEVSLDGFLRGLGVTLKDCRKALEEPTDG